MNVTHYTTERQRTLPAGASGTSITPNAGSYVNSAWFEITSGLSEDILLVAVVVGDAVIVDWRLDIGTGAASAETVRATLIEHGEATSNTHVAELKPALHIQKNTRIAARLRKSDTNTSVWTVKLVYYELLAGSGGGGHGAGSGSGGGKQRPAKSQKPRLPYREVKYFRLRRRI